MFIFILAKSNYMKIINLVFCLTIGIVANAQIGNNGSGTAGAGEISSFKSANMSLNIDPFGVIDRDGTILGIRYADISGTPFLFESWRLASIIDIGNKKIAQVKVKYNTNSDQIHFLDEKDKELVADKSIIRKVEIIADLENNEPAIKFEKGFTDTKSILKPYQFVQVLNDGPIQILKHFTNQILQKDSLFGTMKIYKFSPNAIYFLKIANNIMSIRKLDQAELYGLLPNQALVINYTKKKLKSEKDFIEFLNYYNKGVL